MCVEEEGDGKALGEVLAQSFISSWIRLPPLFISLCRALREVFFSLAPLLSSCLHFHLSPLYPSVLSLLRMDECECAARNSVHRSLLHWQGWPLSSSVSDATRRLHSGLIQEGWSGCWLESSESFCLSSSEKQTLDLTSSHCNTWNVVTCICFWFTFEFCFLLLKLLPPSDDKKSTVIVPFNINSKGQLKLIWKSVLVPHSCFVSLSLCCGSARRHYPVMHIFILKMLQPLKPTKPQISFSSAPLWFFAQNEDRGICPPSLTFKLP